MILVDHRYLDRFKMVECPPMVLFYKENFKREILSLLIKDCLWNILCLKVAKDFSAFCMPINWTRIFPTRIKIL